MAAEDNPSSDFPRTPRALMSFGSGIGSVGAPVSRPLAERGLGRFCASLLKKSPARPQTALNSLAQARRWDWVLSLGLLLIVWEVLCRTGLFVETILVPPDKVFATFIELCESGDISANLWISLFRLATGFTIGTLLGLAFGLLLGLVPSAERYFGMIFHMLRQIPVIAMVPLLMLIFGIQESFKIAMIAIATFFPMALNAYDGTRAVPVRYREVAAVLCFSRRSLIRRVILPAALPAIMTGIRLSLSRAWIILVAAELLASSSGMGHLMEWGRKLFQLDIVLASVLAAGIIGLGLDVSVQLCERYFSRWKA